jgi:hypothetical protein
VCIAVKISINESRSKKGVFTNLKLTYRLSYTVFEDIVLEKTKQKRYAAELLSSAFIL